MRMVRQFKTLFQSSLLAFVVVGALSIPVTPTGNLQVAEAQRAVTVIGGNGTIQETISAGANTVVAGLQTTLNIKELTLDGIAFGLAKTAVQSMTQSIVNWINSGFQGSPAFIDDLNSYLVDRADEIVGDFIYNDPALNFLCSPFQLDVRAALAVSYQDGSRGGSTAQCTLNDVSDNVEGFLSGNFADGGWPAWFEVTQNPGNTPVGAYLEAESELIARIADDRGRTVQELDWGNGFLSFKVCDGGASGFGSSTDRCDITTPGTVIANQLNKSLGAGQDALIEADEINEIIAALFSQLAQQAILGLNGLIGLGGSERYSGGGYGADGSQSFLEAMLEEDVNRDQLLGEEPIANAIRNQEVYIELQQQIVDDVNEVQAEIDRLTALYAEDDSCTFTYTLPDNLAEELADATASIASTSATLTTLNEIQADYESAVSATERDVAIAPFMQLLAETNPKNEVDSIQLRLRIQNDFTPMITSANTEINRAARNCGEEAGNDRG